MMKLSSGTRWQNQFGLKEIIKMEQYLLQSSQSVSGHWVLTDVLNGVVVTFEECRFNETQKVTFLNDMSLSAVEVASILRTMSDWLLKHHPEVLFEVKDENRSSVNRRFRQLVGAILKEAREKRGMSVRQLADETGVDKSMICRIEGGRSNSTIDVYCALLTALRVRVDLTIKD